MRLLAIETSTEACSVAVMVDGAVSERFEIAPRRHAELVLPWAETLLAEARLRRADLDAIAVSRGPGAFTGVRLGISIAQGIALALDRPLVAVSTLAVLASGGLRTQREACRDALDHAAGVDADSDADVPDVEALPGGFILAAIDARMGEVYAGSFVRDGDGLRALDREVVAAPDVVELPPGGSWHGVGVGVGVGTGFAAADGALARRLGDRLASIDARALPRAADLARLAALALAEGGGIAPELVEPAYLRNNVALTLAEQVAARERRG
ncbi:tRNA (adenosine(37)-N6)-threonylcarbamoyltransferase complex dimerization subunit type 1 TsaB [Luteimonas sp. MJ174]|uniref:tRNA (adenosine(37)-N6)-threonylcarbamoyltransferase complex dimerization subunit type 1 TsaB n=1 Tax=Luteimonas sp. MJ174 TaxID=3129237 RepID=UPI0031B9BD8D